MVYLIVWYDNLVRDLLIRWFIIENIDSTYALVGGHAK